MSDVAITWDGEDWESYLWNHSHSSVLSESTVDNLPNIQRLYVTTCRLLHSQWLVSWLNKLPWLSHGGKRWILNISWDQIGFFFYQIVFVYLTEILLSPPTSDFIAPFMFMLAIYQISSIARVFLSSQKIRLLFL